MGEPSFLYAVFFLLAFVAGIVLSVYVFHVALWNVIEISLRQTIVPDRMLGRVNGAYDLLGVGGLAFGALLGEWWRGASD